MATETLTDAMMLDVKSGSTLLPTSSKPDHPSVTVTKATPYTFDLGHLLAIDPNPLSPTTTTTTTNQNEILKATARDGAQSLLNTLLSTRPIASTPEGLSLSLPQVESHLPRWKPLPKPKPPTKWESFARKKGIGKFGGAASGGAKLEDRKKNMVYDEESGEWVKKWGYKGKNKEGEGAGDWLVELDEKKQKEKKGKGEGREEEGRNVRMEGKRERMERVRRQERRERSNTKRGGKKERA